VRGVGQRRNASQGSASAIRAGRTIGTCLRNSRVRNPLTEDSALTRTKIAQRGRRLAPDGLDERGQVQTPGDERRLLGAAGARLQRVIVAAIETCCRRGELLSVRWRDVNLARGELTIRAMGAKDAEKCVLPISARLATVLEMARTDPGGRRIRQPPTCSGTSAGA
jgi:integrase